MTASSASTEPHERGLSPRERRLLALLALPTLGFALAITVVTTYIPVVAQEFVDSTVVIGLLIGAEGLLALGLPLAAGVWSDQLRSPLGGRLPFVVAGTPVMVAALIVLGFVGGLGTLAPAVLLFFAAYFVAYAPYRALYPDVVEEEIAARSQSAQAVARGAGTGAALLGGGLLLAIAQSVLFIVAAALLLASVAAFMHVLLRRRGVPEQEREVERGAGEAARHIRRLIEEHPSLRTFMGANALWELSLGALKTFVVLYITIGLGLSLSAASGIIGGAAVFVLAGSAVSGKLADRFGRQRVMRVALWGYGTGLLLPFVTQSTVVLVPAVPFIAFGGGVVMTLPFALLMPLMPEREHGTVTGFYSLSRGLGTMLGPLIAGLAIEIARGPLSGTEGYAAMWFVTAAAVLLSLPLLRRLGERARQEAAGAARG